MTSKFYLILLSCFILKQGLVAQIVPPPATQTEVDAGLNRFKYVTPYTLANRAGGGSGSPGGATPMLQMNMGNTFVGTTNLYYDVTNKIFYLLPSGVIPEIIYGNVSASLGVTNRFSGANWIHHSYVTDPVFSFGVGNTGSGTEGGLKIYTNKVTSYSLKHSDLGSGSLPWREIYKAPTPIVILSGQTNLLLTNYVTQSFFQQTNGSHGLNLNLAVPESGYQVSYSVSNSGSSDITVTFYTNNVQANPYDIATKTNANTFTASARAITEAKLKFIGGGIWVLESVKGPASILKFGTGIWSDTNGANGLDITPFTRRYTNYASASITINCATDVTANYTNAVAANNTITLATPVIGTSGSLGLVSDASARTLAILAPVAITWLSTNDTANATNILTTASKRSLFAWRVGLGTDGVTTNIHCWVKNQTP